MWYYHPESDCLFQTNHPLGMESFEACLCEELTEEKAQAMIAKKGKAMEHAEPIESTAVRVAVGDDANPADVGAVAESPHAGVIQNDTLVKLFVKIRDAKRAFVKAHEAELEEKYEKALRQIQTELKQRCVGLGNTGLKTDYGTVYLAENLKVSCSDWAIFHQWIKENDALDFLEQRVKAGEVKTYMQDHQGELPPGLSVFRELEARVRKPTKRGSKAVVGEDPADEE